MVVAHVYIFKIKKSMCTICARLLCLVYDGVLHNKYTLPDTSCIPIYIIVSNNGLNKIQKTLKKKKRKWKERIYVNDYYVLLPGYMHWKRAFFFFFGVEKYLFVLFLGFYFLYIPFTLIIYVIYLTLIEIGQYAFNIHTYLYTMKKFSSFYSILFCCR